MLFPSPDVVWCCQSLVLFGLWSLTTQEADESKNTYFYQPFTKSEKGRRKKTNGKVKSCAVRFSTQQFSFSESKSQLLITIKTWTKTQVVKLKCNYSHLKVNTRISDNVTRDGHPTNIAFLRPIFDDFKSQYSNMSANIFPLTTSCRAPSSGQTIYNVNTQHGGRVFLPSLLFSGFP